MLNSKQRGLVVKKEKTKDRRVNPYRLCLEGGLTLVPLPEFEPVAKKVKEFIEDKWPDTPIDIVVPVYGTHSNQEPWCDLGNDHINGHDCVIIGSGPGTQIHLSTLWITENALVARGAKRISIVESYLSLSRSDKDEGKKRIAMFKFFALMTEAAASGLLHKIIAPDLHAPQLVIGFSKTGMLTDVTLLGRVLEQVLEDAKKTKLPVCVYLPDDGACKKFERIAKPYDVTDGSTNRLQNLLDKIPKVYGRKRRQNSTSVKLEGLSGDVAALAGSLVIIIDDEIATAKTIEQTAQSAVQGHGAKACWAAVVHGVLCGKAVKILSEKKCSLNRIYITDTIPTANRPELKTLIEGKKIRVVPWNKDLSKMIYYMHWGESLRELR